MRFIRGFLAAAAYGLVFLGSAQAQSVNNGVTTVLSTADSQNANVLSVQMIQLKTVQTIQSLSLYVTTTGGNLILGVYDATGPKGGPGALKASTVSFAPKTGWNTAKVVTPASLAPGNYWMAFLPSSNALGFATYRGLDYCRYYSYTFGALPKTFSASPVDCSPTAWSFYATLTTSTSSAVNGVCGSSNGATVSAKPTANLCTAGTASAVGGSGPWSWSCAGSNGGTTATCSDKLASTTGQWRMRLLERSDGQRQADRQPLHRRHGVVGRRQRPVVVSPAPAAAAGQRRPARIRSLPHPSTACAAPRTERRSAPSRPPTSAPPARRRRSAAAGRGRGPAPAAMAAPPRRAPTSSPPPAPDPQAACLRPIVTQRQTGRWPECFLREASPTGPRFARR